MQEHSGWPWPTKETSSPYYNRIIIEARMRKGPYSWPSYGIRKDFYAWCWFQFRNIRRHANGKIDISEIAWMKVIGWGDRGRVIVQAKTNDLLHVEGWLTVARDYRLRENMAIVAKSVAIRTDLRVSAWERTADRMRAGKRVGHRNPTMREVEDHDRRKLIKKGLIRPSLGEIASMPDDVPAVDYSGLDFDV